MFFPQEEEEEGKTNEGDFALGQSQAQGSVLSGPAPTQLNGPQRRAISFQLCLLFTDWGLTRHPACYRQLLSSPARVPTLP